MNTLVVDDSASAALDYFQSSFAPPVYDARMTDTYYESFFPVSGVKDVDNIRFSIPAKKGGKVLDVSKAIMCINLKMTNKDKTGPPADDTKAAPCHNFTSSIFCSVNVKFNDTTVCHISNYGVYSHLTYILNTDNNDTSTWMRNLLWEKDTTDNWDDTTTNEGWKNRRNHFGATVGGKFKFQKEAEFYMAQLRTFLPPFHFLPHCDCVIDLELAKPDYVFQSADDATANKNVNFEIEDFRLLVPCHFE